MTLREWTVRVAGLWSFTQENYPDMRPSLHDRLRHVALHQVKDAGRLVAAIEPLDHGRPVDTQMMIRSVRNSLVNALRLCDLLAVSADDLLRDYEAEMTAPAVRP